MAAYIFATLDYAQEIAWRDHGHVNCQPHKEVARAAFVRHGDNNILVVEPAAGYQKANEPVFDPQRLAGLTGVDKVRVVTGIPMDKRHNSKIDYVALAGLLSRLDE